MLAWATWSPARIDTANRPDPAMSGWVSCFGDTEASTIKLTLTTVTRSRVEENAVDFKAEEPQFSLREALGSQISDEDQRRLERIGVRTVEQLSELRRTAGTDVVAAIPGRGRRDAWDIR